MGPRPLSLYVHYVENVGSKRVLEKAGFKSEGVLRKYFVLKGKTRDMEIFSLLSTEVSQI